MATAANPARRPPEGGGAHRSTAIGILEDGFVSGVIGALSVAAFFFVVDLAAGRPFFTPTLLGSVLFLGEGVESVSTVQAPMVMAYTGLHVLLFVVVGLAAAFAVHEFEVHPHLGVLLLMMFVCFEAGFIGLATAIMPGVVGTLGTALVTLANLLSAAAMAGYLLWRHPTAWRELDHVWDDAG